MFENLLLLLLVICLFQFILCFLFSNPIVLSVLFLINIKYNKILTFLNFLFIFAEINKF